MSGSMRFIDADGYSWQVCEVPRADQAPSDTQRGWLYFFSRDATRVLSPYPENWQDLSWHELEELCRGAMAPRARVRTWAPRAPNAGRTADARP